MDFDELNYPCQLLQYFAKHSAKREVSRIMKSVFLYFISVCWSKVADDLSNAAAFDRSQVATCAITSRRRRLKQIIHQLPCFLTANQIGHRFGAQISNSYD